MNYALDALWWRLHTPEVRDLATLLTAPAPWHSSCELPITQLLGDHGFRFLLKLDKQPESLLYFLNKQSFHQNRLGIYAEKLLTYWFEHAPHCQLIKTNLVIFSKKKTLGALDFIVKLNDTLYHLELTCKYYGSRHQDITTFIGLNQADKLETKIVKLDLQLALSTQPEALIALQKLGVDTSYIKRASIIRGMLFTTTNISTQSIINPFYWQGYWTDNWSALQQQLELDCDTRFWLHNHLSLLSPAKVSARELLNFSQIQHLQQGIIALLQQRQDGYWHEVQRIMKINNHKN